MSASPAKKRASTGKAKKVASHPTYAQMTKMAIQSLKERSGSSKAAVLKYILSHYKVGDNIKSINSHLRAALVRGVKSGAFKQVKGTGASGSFRLAEKAKAPAKKKASPKKKATKPKTAKPKAKKPKASPKKAKASPKKPKSPKKVNTPKKAASPKKAKTPKKSTPKKSKSPKKATPKK